MTTRDVLLAETFVETSQILVSDFDVVDVMTTLATRCVELFDATEAGIMLADREGGLQVVASSSRTMNHLELFEIQHDEGPCIDCYSTGDFVACENLEEARVRWPRFTPEARGAGMQAAWAVPLKLRENTIGSLNLLRDKPGTLNEDDRDVVQALAAVATIALVQKRAAEDIEVLNYQLETALASRVEIEQAKGVLAEHAGLTVDDAFDTLRKYARSNHKLLGDVARDVSQRNMGVIERIASDSPPRGS